MHHLITVPVFALTIYYSCGISADLKLICSTNPFLVFLVPCGLPSRILDSDPTDWTLALFYFSFFLDVLDQAKDTVVFSDRVKLSSCRVLLRVPHTNHG